MERQYIGQERPYKYSLFFNVIKAIEKWQRIRSGSWGNWCQLVHNSVSAEIPSVVLTSEVAKVECTPYFCNPELDHLGKNRTHWAKSLHLRNDLNALTLLVIKPHNSLLRGRCQHYTTAAVTNGSRKPTPETSHDGLTVISSWNGVPLKSHPLPLSSELPGDLDQAGWSSQLLILQLRTALDPRRATQKSSCNEFQDHQGSSLFLWQHFGKIGTGWTEVGVGRPS